MEKLFVVFLEKNKEPKHNYMVIAQNRKEARAEALRQFRDEHPDNHDDWDTVVFDIRLPTPKET